MTPEFTTDLNKVPAPTSRLIRAMSASKMRLLLFGITLFLFCTFVAPSAPSYAIPETQVQGLPGSNQLIDYGNKFVDTRVLIPEGVAQEDVARRPFIYWRAWANQKLPFLRALIFLLLVTVITNFVAARSVAQAVSIYRDKWLRSFGIGILVFTIGGLTAGIMNRMGLFAPASLAVIIAVQFAAILGLTVVAHSTGDAILTTLKLEAKISKPWLRSLLTMMLGATVLSLLVLIPGAGMLPRMGTRMLCLLAAAGAGAYFTARQGRRSH